MIIGTRQRLAKIQKQYQCIMRGETIETGLFQKDFRCTD
jgi:hypothetical protein